MAAGIWTRNTQRVPATLAALLLVALAPGVCGAAPLFSSSDRIHPVFGRGGMVATQEATATGVGVEVLRQGGNAVDAAVAVGFALAVTLPRAGNLGGGGFMLVHIAAPASTVAIDYRERAPAAATRDMYLDADGEVDETKARFSYHAVGVPGTVAGLLMAHRMFGRLDLGRLIAPAIAMAEGGIVVSEPMAESLRRGAGRLKRWPQTSAIFLRPDGTALRAGERLEQLDLAGSLRAIASGGEDAFYRGEIAKQIVADMSAHGGPVTAEDLDAYRAIVREPVVGRYRGLRIASMPPPSSGGIHLIQILNILEAYPLAYLGHNGAETIHLMVESMKLAYADRSQHLGDPSFWKVPVRGLVSKSYSESLRGRIDRDSARPSSAISPGDPVPYEGEETTHYSIMDGEGNAVSNTYTLNFSFGTGIVATGTGILLNNEMDDFSAKPGTPNAYGLIGGEANAVEAGKRPLSSMTPTIVLDDHGALLATGSPGGSRIITTVLQVLLNVIDHGMNLAEATWAPRIHHQWLPDELRVEEGLSPDTLRLLVTRGHRAVVKPVMGSVQSVMRSDGGFLGSSDPRQPGALAAGPALRQER